MGNQKTSKRPRSKRSATAAELIEQAVNVGKSAVKQAQRQVPPELKDQVDRILAEANKRWEEQLGKAAKQAASRGDLDRLAERLDKLSTKVKALSKQIAERSETTKTARVAAAEPEAEAPVEAAAAAPPPAVNAGAPSTTTKKAPSRQAVRRTRKSKEDGS